MKIMHKMTVREHQFTLTHKKLPQTKCLYIYIKLSTYRLYNKCRGEFLLIRLHAGNIIQKTSIAVHEVWIT